MKYIILVVALILSIASIFGCIAVNGYGYLTAPDYNQDIAIDIRVNEISQKYVGMDAKELDHYVCEEVQLFPKLAARFSSMYSHNTAIKEWNKNPDKFLKRYESNVERLSKMGSKNYALQVILGFWGVGFLAIIAIGVWAAFGEDHDGGGWLITGAGEIIPDGGGCAVPIIIFGFYIALALFAAPAVPFIALIGSLVAIINQ